MLDSLSANAYGIYLVHYVFVLWLQYALIGASQSVFVKVIFVFAVALVLSWATSAGAKQVGKRVAEAVKALARAPTTISHKGAIADQTR